jgi:hypothetical protein
MASKRYGKTVSGAPLTDKLVEQLAKHAEAGYDVEETLGRRGGRPLIGSGPAGVESVRLEPELRAALRQRASRDKETTSAVLRSALRGYLGLQREPENSSGAVNRPFLSSGGLPTEQDSVVLPPDPERRTSRDVSTPTDAGRVNTRRLGPDHALSDANYQGLNEAFYRGDPADYFMRRLQGLVLLQGNPDGVNALLRQGVDAGSVHIRLDADLEAGTESAKQESERRSRYIVADAWLLLHHASETLLRLYLAHSGAHACPPLEVARQRSPGDFKRKVATRFQRQPPSDDHYAMNGLTFYGSPSADGLQEYDGESRQALLVNIEGLLRLYAGIFLDAESYNAIKHGMAVQTGHSRLEVKVDDLDLGATEGAHVEYLGLSHKSERSVWAMKTSWLDLDVIMAEIVIAQRMILALWLMAQHRYLGTALDSVPSLRGPSASDLRRSDSVTWLSMVRDLTYDSVV